VFFFFLVQKGYVSVARTTKARRRLGKRNSTEKEIPRKTKKQSGSPKCTNDAVRDDACSLPCRDFQDVATCVA
jgi:hypothetical protein